MAKKRRITMFPRKSRNRRVGTSSKKSLMRDLAIAAAVGALQGKIPDSIMEKSKGMAPAAALLLAGKFLGSAALMTAGAYAAGRGVAGLVPALQGDDEQYSSALSKWASPSITGDMGVELVAMSDDEGDIDLDNLGVEYLPMSGETIEELSAESLVGEQYQELGTNIVSIDPDSLRAEYWTPAALFGEEVEEVSQRELDELVQAASMSGFLPAMRARVARTSRMNQQGVALANARKLSVAARAVESASNRQVDPAKRQALRTIGNRLNAAAKANAAAAASVAPWKERATIVRSGTERIVDLKLL